MYHYTECGLTNVWLLNGYDEHSTEYGEGVSFHDIEGLHKAIGLHIAKYRTKLTGQEVRFLRIEMDLSQHELASRLGVKESSVRGWEKERTHISGPSERLLRVMYQGHVEVSATISDFISRVSKMDNEERSDEIRLELDSEKWLEVA